MPNELKLPKIDRYISWLGHLSYRGSDMGFTYDQQSYKDIDEIFKLLKKIKPNGAVKTWELWIPAQRGTIDDFGDYEESVDAGEVETREEFEQLWQDSYPDPVDWYEFAAVDDTAIDFRAIYVGHRFCIQVDNRSPHDGFPHDISPFTGWLLQSVKDCIQKLQDGTYMDSLAALPPKHRTGTITRNDYWKVYPERKTAYFEDLPQSDIEDFISIARKLPEKPRNRLPAMTANDFYRFCSMGYAANKYNGLNMSPERQYYRHADGRVEGLNEIDPDSPEAFRAWYEERESWGHPWEVCRGGNHNHIDLFVRLDARGFYLQLAGSSWDRTMETVRFFLALYRAGLPVVLYESKLLASRLEGTEKIGVVPEGIYPIYCRSMFPGEKIIDFINLSEDRQDELLQYCEWQPLKEVQLVRKRKKKSAPEGR